MAALWFRMEGSGVGRGGVWRQCRRERTKGGKGEKKGERVLVWLGGWGQEVTASTVRGKGSGSEGSLKGRGGRGFAAREASKEGASGCGYLIGLLWYRGRSGLPADWVGAGLTLPPRRREKSGGGSTSHDAPMSTDSSTSLTSPSRSLREDQLLRREELKREEGGAAGVRGDPEGPAAAAEVDRDTTLASRPPVWRPGRGLSCPAEGRGEMRRFSEEPREDPSVYCSTRALVALQPLVRRRRAVLVTSLTWVGGLASSVLSVASPGEAAKLGHTRMEALVVSRSGVSSACDSKLWSPREAPAAP